MLTHWMNRYYGSVWHRMKLLVRGITGLFLVIYLTVGLLILIILELGNKAWDVILEDDK